MRDPRILLPVVLFLLAGCGGDKSELFTIHAAQPLQVSCPQLTVGPSSDGGMLGIGTGVCTINGQGSGQYTASTVLSQDIHADWEESWIGTQANQKLEVGTELAITTPDGRRRLLLNEFDKHTDDRGDAVKTWPLLMNLPRGTRLDVTVKYNSISQCPCSLEASWTFNGNLP